MLSVIHTSRFHSLALSPPCAGAKPRAVARLGCVLQGGPGTPSVKPSLCLLSCSSRQTGSWTVFFFLNFLGLTCYYGVIFHLGVLLFLVLGSAATFLFPCLRDLCGYSLPSERLWKWCALWPCCLPPVITGQVCCWQVGCAFAHTDVSIHNSSRPILGLVTNPYSSEYFFLCMYLKICIRTVTHCSKCLPSSLGTPRFLQG